MQLNRKILNVALLRLRFRSIAASKPDPNLSIISAMLFLYRPSILSRAVFFSQTCKVGVEKFTFPWGKVKT